IGDIEKKIEETSLEIIKAKSQAQCAKEREAATAKAAEDKRHDLDAQSEKKRSHDLLSERIARLDASTSEKRGAALAEERRLKEIERSKSLLSELEPKLRRLEIIKACLEALEPKRKAYDELNRRLIRTRAELDGASRVLDEYRQRLQALERDKKDLGEIEHLELEYHEISASFSRLEEIRDSHTDLQNRLKGDLIRDDSLKENLAKANEAIAQLRDSRKRMEELQPLVEKHSQLQMELGEANRQRELQKELDALMQRKNDLESRRQRLTIRLSQVQNESSLLGEIEAREENLRKQDLELDRLQSELLDAISDLKSNLGIQESRRNDAKKNLARARSLGEEGSCPTCERPLGEHCVQLIQKYELAVSDADEKISGKKNEIQAQADRLSGVTTSRSMLKKSFDEVNALKRKRAELMTEGRGLRAQADEIDSELKLNQISIKALGEVRFDPVALAGVRDVLDKMAPLIEELKRLQSRAEDLPKREAEAEALVSERLIVAKRTKALAEEIRTLGYDEAQYAKEKKRLSELKPVHEKFASLSERTREMPDLVSRVDDQKEALGKIGLARADLDRSIADLGFDPAEFEHQMAERKDLARAEESASRIRISIASEPEIVERLEEIRSALTKLEEEAAAGRKEIALLGYDQELHKVAKNALGQAESALELARKETSSSLVRLGVLDGEMKRLEEDARRKNAYEIELSGLSTRMQVVDSTRSLVNRFMDQILVRIRDEIAQEAGRILDEVTGKYSTLIIDENFNILVEDGGSFYPISRYSGGEIDMIAVSVRVAISEYLMRFGRDKPGYSFLIMDEIFGSQDLEHREKMIGMLRKLDDRFPQIFAISHISDVQGQFDNTINVIEDENGCSRIEVS
ncbi:MAG TPA: SMC family ATPase, partial [Methanotrichaceae archaeon]|nr:SMC family ATPase [Methanotrichaceae archaeon]